jgi:capsid protein
MSQSNYSSARQGIIEDEQTYIEDTELIMEGLFDEVYESFIISGVLSGLFSIPDFWEEDKKDIYLAHEWVAAPKRWIDPLKEVQAMQIAVATGQKTFQQASAEGGQDWHKVVDDMVEVLDYGKSKGIDLGRILYAQDVDPAAEEPPQGEEGEGEGSGGDGSGVNPPTPGGEGGESNYEPVASGDE